MLGLALAMACSPTRDGSDATASSRSRDAIRSEADAADPAAPTPDDPAYPAPEDVQTSPNVAIVSLSPLATRFLFELGVGARIVAVDRASHGLPGLGSLPITDRAGAERFAPAHILIPERRGEAQDAGDPRVLEFAPHDLEDVYALCREIGIPLAGEAEATELERRIARPIAQVAGESPPEGRPGIVALVALEPLEIAGGHSFETDLIEAAGGNSLTHGGDDTRRLVEREDLRRLRPDLIVAMSDRELAADAQERIALTVGDLAPVLFFVFDREDFWLEEPARDALRLRELIASFRAAPHEARSPALPQSPATPTW